MGMDISIRAVTEDENDWGEEIGESLRFPQYLKRENDKPVDFYNACINWADHKVSPHQATKVVAELMAKETNKEEPNWDLVNFMIAFLKECSWVLSEKDILNVDGKPLKYYIDVGY